MDVFENEGYAKEVDAILALHSEELEKVFSNVGDFGVYLIGGAVRDPIVNLLHGKNLKVSDYDFFIDVAKNKTDFSKVFDGYNNLSTSRFGNPKFIFDGFDVDLVLSNNVRAIQLYGLKPNLENLLKYVDISTSGLAYSLENSNFYSFDAISDIKNGELGFVDNNCMSADLSRVILHSEKLGFSIKDSALDYIRMHYENSLDREIVDYLKYKGKEDSIDLVLTKLKKIKKE